MKKNKDISNNSHSTTFTSDNFTFVSEAFTPELREIKPNDCFDDITIIGTPNMVPFPGVPLPFQIENKEQLEVFEELQGKGMYVVVCPFVNPNKTPSRSNLARYGVLVQAMKVVDLPDDSKNVLLLGAERVKIVSAHKTSGCIFKGFVEVAIEKLSSRQEKEFEATLQLIEEAKEYIDRKLESHGNFHITPAPDAIKNSPNYLSFLAFTSPVDYQEKLHALEQSSLLKRAQMLLKAIDTSRQVFDLKEDIYHRATEALSREQRDHFIHAHIKALQEQLDEEEANDEKSLSDRAEKKNWSKEARKVFDREMKKLTRVNPNSPDYSIQYSYLDTLLKLPWDEIRKDPIDIVKLTSDLERDHFGLDKVKERIVEHIAVLRQRGDMRAPILCLYGPPGIGKTSLCRSIADSLGREYVRMSLGGVHDEAEIRGHRKTYIGAMPGRIIGELVKCQTNNPIFVLDEIDKIGSDHRGDPAQALLEVLDPEQNSHFHDNYLDVDYDLSKVFFIATANSTAPISMPLLDRMELIEISGYSPEEKVEIAKRHLVPKQLEQHGFERDFFRFTDDALLLIINSYTRESGVRKLEKVIAKIFRRLALKLAKNEEVTPEINAELVSNLLGKEDVVREDYEGFTPTGVATGLAWTAVGGEILFIESSLSKGKGNITVTGNLGDVMKESATIAYQWVKSHAQHLDISEDEFGKTDIHIHVPEGAVPKDGPSAGITMIASIASSYTKRQVKGGFAMTGEATLRGKILPVGGIKEKILAAKRAGITDIVLSEKNRVDVEEVGEEYINGLNCHYVKSVEEALGILLM